MAGSAGYFKFTLPEGGAQTITVSAEFISCLAATGEFEIVADDVNRMFMQAGISYVNSPGEIYSRLRVLNKIAGDNEIVIQFGPGELRDQRLTVSGAVNVVNEPGTEMAVAPAPAAVFDVEQVRAAGILKFGVVVPAGGWPDILAANPDRRAATISNRGTETVYIASNAGPANNGIPLAPGETIRIETVSVIQAYNPSAVSVTLGGVQEVF